MSTHGRQVFGAEVIIHRTQCVCALFAVHLYILGDFFSVSLCVWLRLQKQPRIHCETHGSVPTASHFHKQMSDNLMTPSSPLPPCTHTSSGSSLVPAVKCLVCTFKLTNKVLFGYTSNFFHFNF